MDGRGDRGLPRYRQQARRRRRRRPDGRGHRRDAGRLQGPHEGRPRRHRTVSEDDSAGPEQGGHHEVAAGQSTRGGAVPAYGGDEMNRRTWTLTAAVLIPVVAAGCAWMRRMKAGESTALRPEQSK